MTFYEMTQALCLTPRWAGLQTTRTESVMEHKALVLMYVHEICDKSKFYADAMRIAIAHDCEEAIVGDIKYTVKKEAGEVFDKILEEIADKKLPEFYKIMYNLESNIIYCADVFSAAHFGLNELNMGNPYFINIAGDMYARCASAVCLIEEKTLRKNSEKILKSFEKLKR